MADFHVGWGVETTQNLTTCCDILANINDPRACSQLEQARGTSQKAMTATF